jgi:uncharacterized protein (DUF58 family)
MGVRLGASGAVFFVSWILLIATAVITQANLLFWGVGLMAGVLMVSLALPWRVVRSLRVERLAMTHGVAGERLTLRYHVTHGGRLPAFALTLTELWGKGARGWRKSGPCAERPIRLVRPPIGWLMHLGPGQRLQADTVTWPMRRGRIEFERIRIETSFPFGVLRVWGDVRQENEVRVYPAIYRLRKGVLSGLSDVDRMGDLGSQQPGGTEEFFGLREYRHGDRPRQIDWKRSSRSGQLVTREYTRPGPPRIDMVLDLTPVEADPSQQARANEPTSSKPWEEDPLECAIALAASVVCEAYLMGYEIGMTVLGADCPGFPARHSPAHRARMLDALSQLRMVHASPAPPPGRSTLIVWAGRGDALPERMSMQRSGETRVLGAMDLYQYVDAAAGRSLLSEKPRSSFRLQTRRMQKSADTNESSGGESIAPGGASEARAGEVRVANAKRPRRREGEVRT